MRETRAHRALLSATLMLLMILGPFGRAAGQTIVTSLPVGNCAFDVAANPATNLIYVSSQCSGTVTVIDGISDTVSATIFGLAGFILDGLTVDPLRNLIYVTSDFFALKVVDGATNSIIASIPVGGGLTSVAVNPVTNKIYVTTFGVGTVVVVDGASYSIDATISIGATATGVAVNPQTNKIYVNAFQLGVVQVIDGVTNTIQASVPVGAGPQGVAVNPKTNVIYVGNQNSGNVSVIDGATNTNVATIPVGGVPRISGVAVNSQTNRIYVANVIGAVIIDGATNSVVTTVPTGGSTAVDVNPNTSRVYVSNSSSVTVIQENQPPVADAGADQTVECAAGSGTLVTLDGSGSSDANGDALTFTWSGPFPEGGGTATGVSPTVTLLPGTHSMTLDVDDGQGGADTDTVSVTVQDTTGPAITNATATPAVLWPPNHQMVLVTLSYNTTDSCDAASGIICSLSVSSNEPVNGTGDGNTAADWGIVDAHHVLLRVERAGSGGGRVYTITTTCTDSRGNASSQSATVSVPHSQK